ncbi:MAG: 50S ribosomal protein L18 [Paludibacteraceae bacterium]|nr:50S ribosomal protein L18 [Paludibacteraceae bacterium]MBO7636403.1 50S ribosomal protein L18 [Paludibacteraceae bacterium]MBR5971381.1 50S ribosomal protein L18 [Paludibacteraceae bacterium]
MTSKIERRLKIKRGIRAKISGSAERPRMTVFRSNKQIYVQLINDEAKSVVNKDKDGREFTSLVGATIVSASSVGITDKISKKEIAAKVGEDIAKKAIAAGIKEVVFDRNGYLYHGRVKELADAARKGGLKF